MTERKPLVLDQVVVPAGTYKVVQLPIARLTSGVEIPLPVHVFHSAQEGPTVLLSGGLHGDEVNGVEIVRRALAGNMLHQLERGTVIAIPIINVYGFLFFSRDVPDGKDVNRSFPGSPDGSLASLVAHTLYTKILPLVDFGIDFHTGGASRTNYPQIRYAKDDDAALEIARAFAAPLSMPSRLIHGSLREAAHKLGVPIVVYEGGESMRFDPFAIDEGLRGIKRVLARWGMRTKSPNPRGLSDRHGRQSKRVRWISENTWVRAEASGLFVSLRQSGQAVEQGELIGRIHNPNDAYTVKVFSPINGFIIGHNNLPMVHRGDALFHVAAEAPEVPEID
jgi:predicted deacylase